MNASSRLPLPWADHARAAYLDTRYEGLVSLIGVAIFLTLPYWLMRLFSYDNDSLFEFPIIIGFNLLMILALTRDDRFLRKTMAIGLAVKVAAASLHLNVGAVLYQWSVDYYAYINDGEKWAGLLKAGVMPPMFPLWGTNFVTALTASLEVLVGRSYASLFIVYAMFAFWGQYFTYRAFCTAFPSQNRRLAALCLFFVPSIAYWTAMVGKDSLLSLGSGLAAYGFALLTRRVSLIGLLSLSLGLMLDFVTRPHIAAVIAVAVTVALALGSHLKGVFRFATRILVFSLVLGMTIYLATQASRIWQVEDYQGGVTRIQQAAEDTAMGGSVFRQAGALPLRIALAPLLIYRPFPWEAGSLQAGFAGLEGIGFVLLTWRSRRSLVMTLKSWRRNPFIVFILVFAFEFIFGFAVAISNFGLLVRQRVMLLPFFLILCCIGNSRQDDFAQPLTPADTGNPSLWLPARR